MIAVSRDRFGELTAPIVFGFPGWKCRWDYLPTSGQTPKTFIAPDGTEWKLLKDLECMLGMKLTQGGAAADDLLAMVEAGKNNANAADVFLSGAARAQECQRSVELMADAAAAGEHIAPNTASGAGAGTCTDARDGDRSREHNQYMNMDVDTLRILVKARGIPDASDAKALRAALQGFDIATTRVQRKRKAMHDDESMDCPVCYVTMEAPIFQCSNGHLLCQSCLVKLEVLAKPRCPTCRTRLRTRIRSLQADRNAEQAIVDRTEPSAASGSSVERATSIAP